MTSILFSPSPQSYRSELLENLAIYRDLSVSDLVIFQCSAMKSMLISSGYIVSTLLCLCCRRGTPFYWSRMHALNTCKPKHGCIWKKVCNFHSEVMNKITSPIKVNLLSCMEVLRIHTFLVLQVIATPIVKDWFNYKYLFDVTVYGSQVV